MFKARSKAKLPVRSWRKPGVLGIFAASPKNDPAFDIAGLPDPFSVYFPVFITNLYTALIYVTALMISPPAGWTDSEQSITLIPVGQNAAVEKSNATRAIPTTPSNETITVRFNYRTGSYAGPIIGFDDFQFTIYWEDITTGTIVSTQDFESPCLTIPPYSCDGWVKTDIVSTTTMLRDTAYVVHGAYALQLAPLATGAECYIQNTVDLVSGTRGYLFGYILFRTGAMGRRVSIVSPVETLEIVCIAANTWRRFGVRLNPGVSNTVQIYHRAYWAAYATNIDYLRWVRF